jgi:hypothetical protein
VGVFGDFDGINVLRGFIVVFQLLLLKSYGLKKFNHKKEKKTLLKSIKVYIISIHIKIL